MANPCASFQDGFIVRLARRQRSIPVRAGQTILDALLAARVPVPYACGEGHCGRCVAPVLAGTPDHRDQVLDPATRTAGHSIALCCSRSHSPVLILDL